MPSDGAPQVQPRARRRSGPRGARRRPAHWLTRGVALLCIVATAADSLAARHPGSAWAIVDSVCHLRLSAVWEGGYWALFTSAFVHGTPASLWLTALHLGFNLVFFLRLGSVLEDTLSPPAWVGFFASAAVMASGAEIALSSTMSVGVSGVLYAMFGLMWAGRRHQPAWRQVATRALLIELMGWGLFCVAATAILRWPIANAAHAGGFVYGLSVGWLMERRRPVEAALALSLLGAITVLAVTWMPWSGVWSEWRGAEEADRGHFAAAVGWYQHSMRLGQDPARVWVRILTAEEAMGDAVGAAKARDALAGLGVAGPQPETGPAGGGYWPEWMQLPQPGVPVPRARAAPPN